ncbi:MAG: D-2-hydroxyacid dehydrogenase family protein [Rhodospirillaceae bacterium]|jgi:phosphoglycerate dehydrogenase-like enzyme
MPRIAILDDYHEVVLEWIDWSVLPDDCELKVFNRPFSNEDDAAKSLKGFEIVVANRERTPFPKTLLERLGDLKLLVTTNMRNLAIDMDAARDNGITVCGTKVIFGPAAEMAWALMLALMKKIPEENTAMHTGGWQAEFGHVVRGKTLGIVGVGKLGSVVSKYGLAFGMNVIGWSQNLTDERCAELGITRVDKETIFRDSDVVTIHQLMSERTRGLVGKHELSLMKPTAYLINTARGPIIDETALIDSLQNKRIAGAGLDVYDKEPLPEDHPLRQLDNVILTGHTSNLNRDNWEICYGEALEDIQAWLKGEPIRVLNQG